MKQSGCSPARVSLPYSRPVFAGEHGLGDGQLVCDRGAADVLGDPCRYIQLVWKRQKLHNIHSQILTNAPPLQRLFILGVTYPSAAARSG